MSEVAAVALFHRDGENVAAGLEDSADSTRGKVGGVYRVPNGLELRTDFQKIIGDLDRNSLGGLGGRVEQVQVTDLFVNDRVRAVVGRDDIKAIRCDDVADPLVAGVIAV